MCVPMTRQKNSYSISICGGGHATLSLGRVAVYLEIDELKHLIHAASEVLADWEGGAEKPQGTGQESLVH